MNLADAHLLYQFYTLICKPSSPLYVQVTKQGQFEIMYKKKVFSLKWTQNKGASMHIASFVARRNLKILERIKDKHTLLANKNSIVQTFYFLSI